MQNFYHVTLKSNWDSIKEKGLVPSIGKLSEDFGESIPAIYLFKNTDDMDNALLNWLGENLEDYYGEEICLLCLEISLPEDYWINKVSDNYEIVHYDIIPAQYIKILREE